MRGNPLSTANAGCTPRAIERQPAIFPAHHRVALTDGRTFGHFDLLAWLDVCWRVFGYKMLSSRDRAVVVAIRV